VVGNLRANLINHTTKLVPQNIALLQLDHCTVQQVEIRAADSAAGDLEDNITRLDNLGLGALDNLDLVLALPDQSLHVLGRVTVLFSVSSRVGDILSGDGIIAMTYGLLGHCCCLCHGHVDCIVFCYFVRAKDTR
jgi:hypothetical protein